MRRILHLALGLGAFAAAAGPALGQATPEEAAKLKAVLEAWVASGVPLGPEEANYLVWRLPATLSIGRWRVEPDGAGYRISSPGTRALLSRGFGGLFSPTVLFCTTSRLRAAPIRPGSFSLTAEDTLSCRLEWTDEPPLRLVAKSQETTGTIELGDRPSASHEIILNQVTFEKGINASAAEGYAPTPQPTIKRLTVSGTRRAAEDRRSDLTSRIVLEGLAGPSPAGTGMVSADRIVYEAGSQGTDVVALSASAIALAKRLAGDARVTGQAPDDDPAVQALLESLLGSVGPDSRQEIRVQGLAASTPTVRVKAESLDFGAAASDFGRDGVRISARLDGKGLAVEPLTAYADWVPVEATAQISIDNAPLWTILSKQMLPGEHTPEDDAQWMLESRTRFRVDGVHLTAPGGALDLKGEIVMSPDAVLGSAGKLQMRLTGIDGLVKALQADPQASQIAAGLSVLQVLGRQTTLPDGRSARDYDIVIDPSGKVLVNGADVQALVPKPL
ncbi:hypothetical protein [Inquilinus limosus]|uniref:hypothetical protein n=1 Tax=Inquilinus limosus TaxID=171674 RepID=UPI0003F5E894|nr:hypothetical protein [Inquilinus limosus]